MEYLTKDEEQILVLAFKSVSQGITNNKTFNDSQHGQGNLDQSGSVDVFAEEDVKIEKPKEGVSNA